ncbi:MAG: hypothetical protein H6774_03430 [Pseudomonadales bacterium]|nr:hypothetical protein [Candidatus Woesebacteria bacterium]MCB9802112.1 hypothetical protein [Pseudomonadales bacterium]
MLQTLYRISGIATFVVLTLGQLGRIQLPTGALYLHDLSISIAVFSWMVLMLKTKSSATFFNQIRHTLQKQPLIVLTLGWISLQVGLEVLVQHDGITLLYAGRLLLYALFVFSLTQSVKRKELRGWILLSLLGHLWLGLLQYVLLPDTRFLTALGWDDHYYRLISTLFDPSFTGLLFVFGYILSLRLKKSTVRWVCTFLFTIGIALTVSRAVWLAFLVGHGVMLLLSQTAKKENARVFIISLIVLITTYALMPKPGGLGVDLTRTQTVEARGETLQQFALSPSELLTGGDMFGVQTTFGTPFIFYRIPDNSIQLILLVGGVPLLVLVGAILVQFWTNTKTTATQKALIMSLMTHSLFTASLIQPFVFLYFWSTLWALGVKKAD